MHELMVFSVAWDALNSCSSVDSVPPLKLFTQYQPHVVQGVAAHHSSIYVTVNDYLLRMERKNPEKFSA